MMLILLSIGGKDVFHRLDAEGRGMFLSDEDKVESSSCPDASGEFKFAGIEEML